MFIYLLRHGDASTDSDYQDYERPLTSDGENQASIVANYLDKLNVKFDLVLTSPLKRAILTASIVTSKVSSPKLLECEYLVNGADQRQLIELLNSFKARSIFLVGHMPHLSDTISYLVNGNYEKGYELKKCSLAVVETASPIIPGNGKLKEILHINIVEKLIQK